ncbi:hypothetical protein V8F33_007706 [Rhypophila sp. PSN 637]
MDNGSVIERHNGENCEPNTPYLAQKGRKDKSAVQKDWDETNAMPDKRESRPTTAEKSYNTIRVPGRSHVSRSNKPAISVDDAALVSPFAPARIGSRKAGRIIHIFPSKWHDETRKGSTRSQVHPSRLSSNEGTIFDMGVKLLARGNDRGELTSILDFGVAVNYELYGSYVLVDYHIADLYLVPDDGISTHVIFWDSTVPGGGSHLYLGTIYTNRY